MFRNGFGRCTGQFFMSFDVVRKAYSNEDKGEPILLVHGFLNSGASWNTIQLKKDLLNNGYLVFTPGFARKWKI